MPTIIRNGYMIDEPFLSGILADEELKLIPEYSDLGQFFEPVGITFSVRNNTKLDFSIENINSPDSSITLSYQTLPVTVKKNGGIFEFSASVSNTGLSQLSSSVYVNGDFVDDSPPPVTIEALAIAVNTPLLTPSDIAARAYVLARADGQTNQVALWRRLAGTTDTFGLWGYVPPSTAVFGVTESALAAATFECLQWDVTSTLDVALANETWTLVPTTKEAILEGTANLAYVGGELIQFRDVQSLGSGRYRLSYLLRGRRGTEDLAIYRPAGQTFALLNDQIAPLTDPLSTKVWDVKALGDYQLLAQANTFQFQSGIRGALPYSVTQIKGTRDENDNLTITWERRSRVPRVQMSTTLPLGETTEAYFLEILDFNENPIRSANLTDRFYFYSRAAQVEDFSGVPGGVRVRIAQLSADIGAGVPNRVIV